MKLKYLITTAFVNIATRKARSFLTILGILIGVAAIIAVMSVGEGATQLVIGELDHMGADTVFVVPGEMEGAGLMDFFFVDLLTTEDLEALKKPANVPHLESIAPAVVVTGRVRKNNESYGGAIPLGSDAEFFSETFDLVPERGNNFSSTDINNRSRVATIGTQVERELFGEQSAVGETITINNERFRVLGVYASRGHVGPYNMDDLILIPYTTVQTYITGNNKFEEFYIKADRVENVDRVVFDVTATLRETRGIQPGESDDFSVMTQESIIEMLDDVMTILNTFLVFVVSIALLVGGIGIMNIMLVSVTERTREIGLRKAVGATRQDILKQFIWEALTLTMIGGVIGIILGSSASWGASMILSQVWAFEWPFVFPIEGAVLGVVMSALAGVIFGLYPAREASRKDPIEALQYEK